MSERLEFRTSHGRMLLSTLSFFTAMGFCIWGMLPMVQWGTISPWVVIAVVAVPVAVMGWLEWTLSRRIALTDEGFTVHSMFHTTSFRWSEVAKVSRLPWLGGGRFALLLTLDRPGSGLWARWLDAPVRTVIGGHYRDAERLFAGVLALAPEGTVEQGVEAWLAGPWRVSWPRRLRVLVPLALLTASLAFASVDVLRSGAGLPWWILACIFLGTGCMMVGFTLDREGSWKSALISDSAVGPMCLLPLCMSALFTGRHAGLMIGLGVWLATSAVTFVVCLPWRPRWPILVPMYAAAIATAVACMWWFGVREPLPVWEVGVAPMSANGPNWLADERSMWTFVEGRDEEGSGMWSVLPREGGEARVLKTQGFSYDVLLAGRHCFLYAERGDTDQDVWQTRLWCLDTRSGEERLLLEAERVRMFAAFGLHVVSPMGDDVAFVAGPDEETSVHVLGLADLSVRQLVLEGVPENVASVRWRDDGLLVLTGCRKVAEEQVEISLWTVRPDGSDLVCVWQQEPDDSDCVVSPSGRWLLHHVGEKDGGTAMTIVSLVNGERRALNLGDLRGLAKVRGLSADNGFVYTVGGDESGDVVLVDWATGRETGRVSDIPTARHELAISPTGRLVAHAVNHGWAKYVRIVEVSTGSSVTLRQSSLFFFGDMSFSPGGRFLAVQRMLLTGPDTRAIVRVIDLRSW